MTKTVKAIVTMNCGIIKTMLVHSWTELTIWLAEHHGEFIAVEAYVWPMKRKV